MLFDVFHHTCFNNKEGVIDALLAASKTWRARDGLLMVDYSSQQAGGRVGKHAQSLDENDFERFIKQTQKINFDIILEIKDKEKSAATAVKIAARHRSLENFL